MFVIPVVTGIGFIVTGLLMLKYPAKRITWIYGYRSRSAMKNQERWNFAQIRAAREFIRTGVILIPIGLSGYIFSLNIVTSLIIGIIIVVIALIIFKIRVETGLKKKFDRGHSP